MFTIKMWGGPERPTGELKRRTMEGKLIRPWPCKTPDCTDCKHHFRSNKPRGEQGFLEEPYLYTEALTDGEARAEAQELLTSANKSRESLRELITLHGDIFMSRWKKRSQDKRTALLRLANPHLPERRNFAIFNLTQTHDFRFDFKDARNPSFLESLLLPYLGIEVLRKDPALIFALIHHRISRTLEEWATFDMYMAHHAWDYGNLDVQVSHLCMVAHGAQYGRLVAFDANAVHRGDLIGFPRAQILLETQAHLLQFLDKLVGLVLEDANLSTPSSSTKWDAMCQDGFRASGDVSEWSSYTSRPFSAPLTFDIDDMLSTANTRLEAASDHIILMQTNPFYTRRYIRALAQGGVWKSLSGLQKYHFIDASIRADVQTAYWWLCVKEELENVRNIRLRFRDQIQQGQPLPPKYNRARAALELVLVNSVNFRANLTVSEMRQRPGFAKHHRIEAKGREIQFTRTTEGCLFQSDPLMWACLMLGAEPDHPEAIDHFLTFAFMDDHLSRSDKKESQRLDEVLVHRYSDLAAYHELLLAVRWSRPQNRSGELQELAATESRRAWQGGLMMATGLPPSSSRQTELLKAFDTADTAEQDVVEKSLAEYWAVMRRSTPALIEDEDFKEVFEADLRPSHIQAVEERKARRQAATAETSRAKTAEVMVFQGEEPSFKRLSDRTVQTKPKTKGEASGAPEGGQVEDFASMAMATTPLRTTLQIPGATKRARDTFGKMFRRDGEARQGCDWATFVHSMRDIGFSVRNGAGSAVTFALGDKGKIAFHRPHPDPQIDRIMLQAMGYRLKKWFGLCEGSFEPAPPA